MAPKIYRILERLRLLRPGGKAPVRHSARAVPHGAWRLQGSTAFASLAKTVTIE